MLAIIRIIIVLFISVVICIFGLIFCLFNPRNPRHTANLGHCFGRMSTIFGISVEVRYSPKIQIPKNCVYIANHQNNYDMVTVSNAVQPRTLMVGKKSLLLIPFFGILYWITGSLLIDRKNKSIAYQTINKIVHNIKKKNVSIWIFPEGTRSRGRGLLPFKNGAFYTAISAGVPIVPICVSNTNKKINLNRWLNGLVLIEIMSPIDTKSYDNKQIRSLAKYCHSIMKDKIEQLNIEVAKREKHKIYNN